MRVGGGQQTISKPSERIGHISISGHEGEKRPLWYCKRESKTVQLFPFSPLSITYCTWQSVGSCQRLNEILKKGRQEITKSNFYFTEFIQTISNFNFKISYWFKTFQRKKFIKYIPYVYKKEIYMLHKPFRPTILEEINAFLICTDVRFIMALTG